MPFLAAPLVRSWPRPTPALGTEALIFEASTRSSRPRIATCQRCTSAPFAGASRSRPGARGSREAGRDPREGGRGCYLSIAGGRAPDVESLGQGGAGIAAERDGQTKSTTTGRSPMRNLRARRPGPRQGASQKARDEAVVAVERAVGVDTIRSTRVVSATFTHRRARASASARHTPGRPASRSRLAGRSSPPWAPGPRVRRPRRTRNFVVDAAPARSWAPDMVGNRVCEVVATMALEGGYEELERIVHPHPPSWKRSSTRPIGGWAIRTRTSGPKRSVQTDSGPRRSLSQRRARRPHGRRTDRLPDAGPISRRALFGGRRAVNQGRTGASASCREPGVDRGVSAGP